MDNEPKKKPQLKDRLTGFAAKVQDVVTLATTTAPDTVLYRWLPYVSMELLRRYFRLEIEGAENIPRRGAAIVAPNHSGYAGLDALLLAHITHHEAKRVPRILTHKFWFKTKLTAAPIQKLGFTEATVENGIHALQKNNTVIIFPEGEDGNFKPSTRMYQLQEFKTGFVRMALATQSPIIPTLVIGAEETHINLSRLRVPKVRGLSVPLPLNVVPLPVKWKFKFLPPIFLPYQSEASEDRELVYDLTSEIQEQMQEALNEEIRKRWR